MEIDRIKYSDLFEGDPFEKAKKNALDFAKSLENLKNINKDLAKNLKETLETISKTNVEELEKVEKLLNISAKIAKQNKEIEGQKQKINKDITGEVKKQTELSFEELKNLQKAKIQKDEILKKAKEQAKQELGIGKGVESQIGAYAKLDKRLKELRAVYKDLAAEAADLALTGDNEEKIKKLTDEMKRLQPEIDAIDKTLKQIDENVGQFQRQVGSYKVAIKESFDALKGQIQDNVKGIIGMDNKFDGMVESIGKTKDEFIQFSEAIKNGEGKVKSFLNLLKNIGKAGLLGIALTLLTTLQATAQGLGGVFNEAKDSTAGLSEGLTALTSKGLLFFQGEWTKASNIAISQSVKLGYEISKLTRLLEKLQRTASNAYGNYASDIETLMQIQNNAFKSDAERYRAAEEALKLQNEEIKLRIAVLEQERQIRQQALDLSIAQTSADKSLVENFLYGNLAIEERKRILEQLPNSVAEAVLNLEETLGNIEVEQERLIRNRVDLNNFYLEKSFKNLAIATRVTIANLKKDLDLQFQSLEDNITFEEAIKKTSDIADNLKESMAKIIDNILIFSGIDLNEINGAMITSYNNAERLQEVLSNIGVGEEQRNLILDVFKDFKDESTKYEIQVNNLKKAEKEAIQDGLRRITLAKEALEIQEKEFDLQQVRSKINEGTLDNIALIKEEDRLLFELRNKRIEAIKRNYLEDLKNKKLTDEQKVALELEYQERINQVSQQYESERATRELERKQRIKQLIAEVTELERIRVETITNAKLQQLENQSLINYVKIKKIYLDLQQIELDRIMIERDALLSTAKTEEEKLLIYKRFNAKREQLEIATQNKIKQLNKRAANEVLDFFQKSLSETQSAVSAKFQKETQNIDRQITIFQQALDKERELATRGVETNIDVVEKKIAELEIKRREQARKEQAIQLGLAFINSVASYAKTDPKTAVQNAFRDIIIAKALAAVVAGAFREGVEDFQGKGTETSDSNLVLISKGESIITAKATKQHKGLATAMNEGKVTEWVKEHYATNIDADALGNLIVTEMTKTGKRIVKSLSKRTRL